MEPVTDGEYSDGEPARPAVASGERGSGAVPPSSTDAGRPQGEPGGTVPGRPPEKGPPGPKKPYQPGSWMSAGNLGPALVALLVAVFIAIVGGEKGRLLFLVLMGGTIAYVGDILGGRFGKKRLSILGIRPKYTALVFNILSGLAITIVTLLGMAMISEPFRVALFQVDELQENLRNLKATVEERRHERDRLSAEAAELTSKVAALDREMGVLAGRVKELTAAKEKIEDERIVFPVGQPLLPQPFLFPVEIKKEEFSQVMMRMVDEIARHAQAKKVILPKEDKDLSHLREVIPNIYQDLQTLRKRFEDRVKSGGMMPKEFFVDARSDKNVIRGEELHNVSFSVGANVKRFDKGEEIASFTMRGDQPRHKILEQLFAFDTRVMLDLKRRGISPYSLEERSRKFTADRLLTFVNLADKIEASNGEVGVEVLAQDDIFVHGAFDLIYRLAPAKKGEAATPETTGGAPAGPRD